jgi:hypothetical protein
VGEAVTAVTQRGRIAEAGACAFGKERVAGLLSESAGKRMVVAGMIHAGPGPCRHQ